MQPVALSAKRYGGRFETEHEIGHGGMGAVYRARDLQTGSFVALKVLYEREGPNADRFTQEAAMLAELSHPAIVRYVHHGVSAGGEHYLAMEWLEGGTLEEPLAIEPMPLAATMEMGARLLDALSVAHRRGMVHRDLKPANILLPDGKLNSAKLVDFGIAQRLFDGRRFTRSDDGAGTPMYMSPEQARGQAEVDARSDIFSLGCVLFQCLTGRAPFTADSAVAVLAKICMAETPSLRALRVGIPQAVEALVHSMLEKQPDKRPGDPLALARSMSSLADQIRRGEVGHTREEDVVDITITPSEQRIFTAVLVQLPRMGPHASPAAQSALVESSAELAAAVDPTGALTSTTPIALQAIRGVGGPTRTNGALVGSTTAGSDGALPRGVAPDLYDESLMSKVQAVATPLHVQVERFYNGSLALTRPEGPNTIEQTVSMARCALELKRILPMAAFAIASSRTDGETVVPVGRVLDRAGTLLVGAPAGSIRLDTLSNDLLHTRFEVAEPELGPIGPRRLLHEKGMTEPPRTLVGRPVPWVGRTSELSRLHSLYSEVVDDSVARSIIVTGPGGVGKTRLLYALLDRMYQHAEGFRLLAGRGEAMRVGQAWSMLGSALRSAANVSGFEAVEVRRKHFAAHIGRNIADRDRRRRIVAFLGEIAGIHFPDDDLPILRLARQDPRAMADQTRSAWMDWVESELNLGPVVLMFEDMHWADVSSFLLVDHVLRLYPNKPLFVAGFGRPEVEEKYPNLWEAHGVERLRLEPLKPKLAKQFVQGVWPEANQDQVAFVVEKGAGNPFFMEELVRVALERGPEALTNTPFSVLAVLQDRLDAVGERGKRVLRAASVFGMRCRLGGVAALLGETDPKEMEVWLAMLAEHEILFCESAGSSRTYAFRHALLREASYATLTDKDRVAAHGAAGDFLEKAGGENAVELAEHFVCGEQLSRAGHWFRLAAQGELAANGLDAGLKSCARACECGVEGTELGLVRLVESRLRFWKGEAALSRLAAEEAVGLLEGVSHVEALAELVNAYGHLALEQSDADAIESYRRSLDRLVSNKHYLADLEVWTAQTLRVGTYCVIGWPDPIRIETFTQLAERAESSTNPLLAAAAINFLSHVERRASQWLPAAQHYQRAAQLFRSAGNLQEAFINEANAVNCLQQCGRLAETLPMLEVLFAETSKHNAAFIADGASFLFCTSLLELGRGPEVKVWSRIAIERSQRHGNTRLEAYVRNSAARAALLMGDIDAAADHIDQAIQLTPDSSPAFPTFLATKAMTCLRRGDVESAVSFATSAERRLVESPEPDLSLAGLFVWVVAVEVHLAAGNRASALAAMRAGQRWRCASEATATNPRPYLYDEWDKLSSLSQVCKLQA